MTISTTLNTLLKYVKTEQKDEPVTWKSLVEHVLGNLYNYNMQQLDVIRIVFKAYNEAMEEDRFNLPTHTCMLQVLCAPITGFHAIDNNYGILGTSYIEDKYTVEQFYDSMLKQMMSDLYMTNIGWLRGDPVTADWLKVVDVK